MFGDYFLYGIVYYLLALLAVLVLVVWLVIKVILHFTRGRGGQKAIGGKNWYLQTSLSPQDAVSQLYFLLGLGFLGVTLFTFNRNLGEPFSWQTILLVSSLAGLAAAYYYKLIYALAYGLLGVIIWWIAQAGVWTSDKSIQTSAVFCTFVLLSLLLIAVGTLHEIRPQLKRAATTFEGLGILMTAGVLFLLSSNGGLDFFENMLKGQQFYASWQLSISLLVLFAALGAAVIYGLSKKLIFTQEAVTIAVLAIVFVVVAFLPQMQIRQGYTYNYYDMASSGVGSLTAAGAFWAMAFNVLTLLGLLSVMLAGNLRRETWQINLGAILLFIYVFVKYFDWFYTYLDKSVFFIGAGILFFVVGFFMERSRKKIIQKISASNVQTP